MKKKHKYIAKVKVTPKSYRYFYTMAEYRAYLGSKNKTPVANKQSILKSGINFIKYIPDYVKNKIDPIADKTLEESKILIKRGKKKFNEIKKDILTDKTTKFLDETFNKIKTKESQDETIKKVNPNYNPNVYEYSNNCAYCTATYDMRRRGYDVEANPVPNPNPNTTEEMLSWYEPKPKVTDERSYERQYMPMLNNLLVNTEKLSKDIENDILKQGEGARGNFNVYWYYGGGHSVAYEVQHGKVVIIDNQAPGERGNNGKLTINDYLKYSNSFEYYRLDDKKPTKKITKTCHNRNKK